MNKINNKHKWHFLICSPKLWTKRKIKAQKAKAENTDSYSCDKHKDCRLQHVYFTLIKNVTILLRGFLNMSVGKRNTLYHRTVISSYSKPSICLKHAQFFRLRHNLLQVCLILWENRQDEGGHFTRILCARYNHILSRLQPEEFHHLSKPY